jgi:sigma-E factor negative regulatory protein RseA
MKEKISALMDGELDERSAGVLIDSLGSEREALETWRHYHLISDAMRDSRLLSEGFAARLGERLAAEPTVLAPRRLRAAEPRKWLGFPAAAAASVAAVSLVGWLAFAPQQPGLPVATVAEAVKSPAVIAAVAPATPPMLKPATVPLPSSANDYLLAHQGFSPRMSLQGMAPYVRTVSDTPQEARK